MKLPEAMLLASLTLAGTGCEARNEQICKNNVGSAARTLHLLDSCPDTLHQDAIDNCIKQNRALIEPVERCMTDMGYQVKCTMPGNDISSMECTDIEETSAPAVHPTAHSL